MMFLLHSLVTRSKSAENNLVNTVAAILTEAPENYIKSLTYGMKFADNSFAIDPKTDLNTVEKEEELLEALIQIQKAKIMERKQREIDNQETTKEPTINNSDKDLINVTKNKKRTVKKGIDENKGVVKNDIESLTVSTKTVSTRTVSKSNANPDVSQNNSTAVENRNKHTEDQKRANKQSIKQTDQQRNGTRRPSSRQ